MRMMKQTAFLAVVGAGGVSYQDRVKQNSECTVQGDVEISQLDKEEVELQAWRSAQEVRLAASLASFTRTMALTNTKATKAYAAPIICDQDARLCRLNRSMLRVVLAL